MGTVEHLPPLGPSVDSRPAQAHNRGGAPTAASASLAHASEGVYGAEPHRQHDHLRYRSPVVRVAAPSEDIGGAADYKPGGEPTALCRLC